MKIVAALLILGIIAPVIAAPDAVVRLEGISIQGNSDEPQVVYITPWQEPPGTKRLYREAFTDRDQWLYTLDPTRLQYEMNAPKQFIRATTTNKK